MTDSDRVIPPGKEGTATLQVNTASQSGQISKSATLFTDDPDRPRIVFTLNANVLRGAPLRAGRHIGPLFISPDARAALFAYPGKKATAEIAITSDDKPVKILRVEGAEKHFASRVEIVEASRSYKIIIDSLPTEVSDIYKERLLVLTDNPTLPAFPINLALRVYSKQ
ncbi:MAG TPA: hypothetical protein VLM38_00470 [Blastocatellia bacterium]|nr:hypothetical protein [Blastocatellia bacterium]